ncbi:MAG: flagellar basal body L-ring protein FlgH [Acidobacteria bacterium]|nr:flagellar basal body L-ring protein FlgH [Acidobacteriota bacterium]MBI3428227.1 flagellar basal body L-ring protein FlgH [Acidobacteriota bacterium]
MQFRQYPCVLSSFALLFLLLPSGLQAQQPVIQTGKKQPSKETKPAHEAPAAETTPLIPYDPVTAEAPHPANGSLYTDSAPNRSLLIDFKATGLGDLLFIDVIETSTAIVSSNAKRSRDSGTLAGLTGVISAIPVAGAATTATALGGLGQRKYEGTGTTGRTSNLRSRVAARVTEVLPNGDFRIEAQKLVKINKEDELLTLSGIVRRRDVSADNAVPTTMVGDLRVHLNGKGVASADNAPGWLFRLFEKISPF